MSRERLRVSMLAAATVVLIAAGGCMDALEPTSVSPVVRITALDEATVASETQVASRFETTLLVRNTSNRTLYLDMGYRRTEKLIDQTWVVALESGATRFASVRVLGPAQTINLSHTASSLDSPPVSVLQHIRGLYRVRLRLAFDRGGLEELPAGESYSQPCPVTW